MMCRTLRAPTHCATRSELGDIFEKEIKVLGKLLVYEKHISELKYEV